MDIKEKQKLLFKRKKDLINRATKYELIAKDILDKKKIKYIFQKAFISGNNFCIVDFYLPKPYKLCIEIDGGYHDTLEQKRKDYYKDLYLRSRGFNVLRIRNENVYNLDILI